MTEKNKHRDYTSGSISRNVLALALPMVLEMGLQTTVNVVDMFWVGKLGPESVAGVAICGVFVMIIYSAVMGLSVSSSLLVARRVGERDLRGAGDIFLQAVYLGLGLSLVFGLPGNLLAGRWLEMLGATGGVVEQGDGYLKIIMGWIFTMVFILVFNAILRGAGEARTAMFVLWFVNILNFLLDPVLIFGLFGLPRMGVRGSATATVICQFLGVLVQLAVILSGRGRIRVVRERIRPRKAILGSLVRLGLPASFQIFVRTISFLMIMRVVAFYGTLALAGYGIAVRLFLFILMPGFGMGNAVATLVGQNLGAGKPERSEKSAWLATGYNLLVMGTLSLAIFVLAEPTVTIFNADPGVVAFGSRALRIIAPSYLLTAVGIVMMRSLMGAGDTLTPMLINLVTLWGFLIPAAYLSWWSGWGPDGIFWSVAAANAFNALLALTWFRKGRWKYIRV